MPAKYHPAYNEENERLKFTLYYVNKSLDASANQKQRLDSEVARGRRHFDSSDSASYTGLMVNTMLQERINLRLVNLQKAKSRPYFARIDFSENEKNVPEKLYIGKMVLIRDEDQELVIVDWRAPVANLYYESRIGEASYLCPDGEVKGNLSLKRQFSIDDGELKEIFDIDITTNDEFLQSYLGANADNRLKDIVSTIQVEQNRIIRADMWKPLIVQGAAGSGKTTIALHRIAYLIYTYEKRFNPENFMIIAPNRLFLNYISTVLPDLGVEKVKQTTFQDFAMELIGKKYRVKDPNEKLVSFVNDRDGKNSAENDILRRDSELKSSIRFKEILDEYISLIEKTYIPREDFQILSVVIFKYDEINNLFLNEYRDLPFMKRVQEIKKHLSNRLKRRKDGIVESLQSQCDRTILKLKASMEDSDERRKLIIEAIDTKNDTIKRIESISKNAVKEYIGKISKPDPYQYYKSLMEDRELFKALSHGKIEDEYIEPIRDMTGRVLNSGYLEIEDLSPIIYIKLRIYGMDEKIPVKHVVIDEAQDFSVFQFYVIKNIIRDSSFTILGDLCQGIHSYRGTRSWEDVKKYAFEEKECALVTLEVSYRTTVEIMEAANSVLKCMKDLNLPTGKPVVRHGDRVKLLKKDTIEETAVDIQQRMAELKAQNYKSIAVICKDDDECREMFKFLKDKKDSPYIINGSEKEYRGGTVILPSYLSKGLEFDACFITSCDSDRYGQNELDAKLLYVSMTRPLHKLYMYYSKEISPLLRNLQAED